MRRPTVVIKVCSFYLHQYVYCREYFHFIFINGLKGFPCCVPYRLVWNMIKSIITSPNRTKIASVAVTLSLLSFFLHLTLQHILICLDVGLIRTRGKINFWIYKPIDATGIKLNCHSNGRNLILLDQCIHRMKNWVKDLSRNITFISYMWSCIQHSTLKVNSLHRQNDWQLSVWSLLLWIN
jgi:hypothetical protein